MKRYDFPQRSPEWTAVRLGIPTSSEFKRIITPKTGKLSEQAKAYMHRLLAEWMLGTPVIGYEGEAMYRGAEMEPEAVAAYEFETDSITEKAGFVTDDRGLIGCSPDRLVIGEQRGLEVKCPISGAVHVGHLFELAIDEKHYPQVQGCIWLMDYQAWDVMSYYPALPNSIIRCHRDVKYIGNLSAALDAFVETMLKARESIVQRYGPYPLSKPAIKEAAAVEDWLGVSEADVDAILAARVEHG